MLYKRINYYKENELDAYVAGRTAKSQGTRWLFDCYNTWGFAFDLFVIPSVQNIQTGEIRGSSNVAVHNIYHSEFNMSYCISSVGHHWRLSR